MDGTDRDMSMSAVGRVSVKAQMDIGIARARFGSGHCIAEDMCDTCPKPREVSTRFGRTRAAPQSQQRV